MEYAQLFSGVRNFFAPKPRECVITRGIGPQSLYDLYRALEDAHIEIGPWAREILSSLSFEFSSDISTCTVRALTGTMLGLGKDGRVCRGDVYVAGDRQGLVLCPPDIAPLIWLQQPKFVSRDSIYNLAMEPIRDTLGNESILSIDRKYKERGLFATTGEASFLWETKQIWLFCVPE